MKSDGKKKYKTATSENLLLNKLDKGIDAMENGRTVSRDKAIQMIREKLKNQANYDI